MDGRPTLTDCDEAGDYVVPNVFSPRDLVSRPDIMDETVPHTVKVNICKGASHRYLIIIHDVSRANLSSGLPIRFDAAVQPQKVAS